MSIRYVSRDNVDLRGESLENPRNIPVLWETPVGSADVTPSDNDYTVAGRIYWTDNAEGYRLWRRNTNVFNPITDANISPDGDFAGRGPYWEEIIVGGAGRDFQTSQTAPTTQSGGTPLESGDEWLDSTSGSQYTWVVADILANSAWVQTSGAGDQSGATSGDSDITRDQADARYFQLTNNFSEVQDAAQARMNLGIEEGGGIDRWAQNTAYAVNDVFFTDEDTTSFPPGARETIYRVASAHTSGTTLTQDLIDNSSIVAISGVNTNNTYFYTPGAYYEVGSLIACLLYTSPSPRDS